MLAPWTIGLVAAILWLLPSAGQLDKYLGAKGAIAVAAIVLLAFPLAFHWLSGRPALDDKRAARVTQILVLVMIGLFAALFPLVLTHIFGGGSDREDALNVALRALLHGRYPYFEKTFLGTRPSPMPGAFLLALPAYLIWRAALQNLFWLPVFVFYSRRIFDSREAQMLFAGVLLLSCPGSMQDFVTGGDYLINSFYVLIATDLVARTHERNEPSGWWRAGACLFFSICISSRPNYVMAVPVLTAFIFQRNGLRRAAEFIGLTALFCAAINLPFFLYSPKYFPLLAQDNKFHGIPAVVHASITIPMAALAVALSSFAVRMNRARVFGMIAASFATVFFVTYAFWFWRFGPAWWIFIEFGYALPVTIFGGVWLMTEWRRTAAPARAAHAGADRGTAAPPAGVR